MEETIHVQVEDNSSLIEHILCPISYISWLLGVGVARPRKCHKIVTIIIRTLHLVACSINVAYGPVIYFFDKKYIFNNIFTFCISWVISYVSAYYYVYQGIKQYNKWLKLMDKIKELDQKIRMEISMNDQPIKNAVVLAILAVFDFCVLFIFAYVMHNVYLKELRIEKNNNLSLSPENFTYKPIRVYFAENKFKMRNKSSIYVPDLQLYYMLIQSMTNNFVFIVIVYVLYYRLRTINILITKLNKFSDASWITLKIRRIRELHNSVRIIIIMINDIHGFHLLFYSVNCLIMVLMVLFRIYIDFQQTRHCFSPMLANIIWIQYVTQFCVICWICTLVRDEFQKTGTFIYEFVLNCKNLECEDCVRNEVADFSNQLQQHRVVFTAHNFFEINNSLFRYFVGVIISYLIILIQFYKPVDHWFQFYKPVDHCIFQLDDCHVF